MGSHSIVTHWRSLAGAQAMSSKIKDMKDQLARAEEQLKVRQVAAHLASIMDRLSQASYSAWVA